MKRTEIEGIIKLMDSKIEEFVYKIPMIKGIENNRKSTKLIASAVQGESKKDK